MRVHLFLSILLHLLRCPSPPSLMTLLLSLSLSPFLSWYSSLPTPSTPIGPVSFHALDFFTFDLPSGAFNLAFDNTFLCALPPSLRSAWGTRYAALLPSPGSLLITRAYPLMDAAEMAKGTGPPWGLNMEIYQTLLPEESWKKVWDGEGGEKGRLVVWERV